jgi:hypothetical protein
LQHVLLFICAWLHAADDASTSSIARQHMALRIQQAAAAAASGKSAHAGTLEGNPLAAAVCRGRRGVEYVASKLPEQALVLWGYEGSPFVKLVKEVLCELELPHLQVRPLNAPLAIRDAGAHFEHPAHAAGRELGASTSTGHQMLPLGAWQLVHAPWPIKVASVTAQFSTRKAQLARQ